MFNIYYNIANMENIIEQSKCSINPQSAIKYRITKLASYRIYENIRNDIGCSILYDWKYVKFSTCTFYNTCTYYTQRLLVASPSSLSRVPLSILYPINKYPLFYIICGISNESNASSSAMFCYFFSPAYAWDEI